MTLCRRKAPAREAGRAPTVHIADSRLRSGYISSPACSLRPLLHPLKNLLIHKRLMSPPDNHPLLFRKTLLPLPFIKGLPPASLYHMPQINLAGKNVFYGRRLPHSGCVPPCFRLPLLITVTGRRRDFPPVQFFRYLPVCHATEEQVKYFPDHRRGFWVGLYTSEIFRAFPVAVRRPCTDKLASLLSERKGGANFPLDIPAVKFIHHISQGNEIPFLVLSRRQGINPLSDCHKAHAQKGKQPFQIVPGIEIISPETG